MSLLPLWAIDLDVDVDVDVNMGAATTTLNGDVRSSQHTLHTHIQLHGTLVC